MPPPTTQLNRSTQGSGSVATLPTRPDPVGELRFHVDLPGVNIGRFRECTGLAAEIEVKDYNEGGVNDRVHKRIAVTISLVGPDGQPVRTWSFADAFPVKWAGPSLNAGSNQVATETLEIVHAGLQMRAGG